MRDLPENQVRSWDDVPEFANEAEEAEFWAAHSFGEELLEQMGPLDDVLPPARPNTRRISMRLDEDTLTRLAALAEVKGQRPERLVEGFIIERLYEEEKRAGLVGQAQPDAEVGVPSPSGAV